jgi:hypothetical protein
MRNSPGRVVVILASGLLGSATIAVVGDTRGATDAANAGNVTGPRATDPGSIRSPIDPDELGFEEIVFVKRKPYSSDHYYTDIDNGTSPDRFLPNNGIYIYNLRTRSERPVVTPRICPAVGASSG